MAARHHVESSRFVCGGTQNPQLNSRKNSEKVVVVFTVVCLISYVPSQRFWPYK
jgi:hypothetical protein